MRPEQQQTVRTLENTGDVAALGGVAATLLELVPEISAVVALLYLIFRFYVEVQNYRRNRKDDR